MLYGQSVNVAADGVVSASPSRAIAAVALAGGSAASTLILYDNATEASGTILLKLAAATGTSAVFTPAAPVTVANGIYADISGTAANATVILV